MYSFVHNKSQNCLSTKKVEALVYIYTNNRLLQGRVGADSLRWYEHNVFSKDQAEGGNDDFDMDDKDEGVIGDLDMDDGDNDKNYYGAEGNEGNEPFNNDNGMTARLVKTLGTKTI